MTIRRALGALWAACALLGPGAAAAHDPPAAPDPPAVMDFVPPAPGTYQLHPIMPAPAGTVLDLEGRRQPLARFTRDKITVLSFIYTGCADARGCPSPIRCSTRCTTGCARRPPCATKCAS